MTVRLYGRAQGNSSHARVTGGFYAALKKAGMLSGFVGLDLAAIGEDVQRETDELALRGAVADHAVFTGALGRLEQMVQQASHKRRWVVVAPNSNLIPALLVRDLQRFATGILAPSHWAASVLDNLFQLEMPIVVVPHGVTPVWSAQEIRRRGELMRQEFEAGKFRVLHFSTSDRERKGTLELVQAWQRLLKEGVIPESSELALVMDYPARIRLVEKLADADILMPKGLTCIDRPDLSPRDMATLLMCGHVVCQPSRGEAFGLVPLEALTVGVPIVATACTGHSEYLNANTDGAVIVDTGELAPIDDLEGAAAPALAVEDIVVALRSAYSYWPSLQHAALEHFEALTERWAWDRQLAPFITLLKSGVT
jgi:glycosyltransferase involved in cell wall biosynthesis